MYSSWRATRLTRLIRIKRKYGGTPNKDLLAKQKNKVCAYFDLLTRLANLLIKLITRVTNRIFLPDVSEKRRRKTTSFSFSFSLHKKHCSPQNNVKNRIIGKTKNHYCLLIMKHLSKSFMFEINGNAITHILFHTSSNHITDKVFM